jgi:hypothetical protein
MFHSRIPFPSFGDKDNIPVPRGEKRTRRNALIGQSASHPTATAALRARLMSCSDTTGKKRIVTKNQSITVLTNPERTRAHSVAAPTIHEKVSPSPLSAAYRPPSVSPVSPPCAHSILNNPAKALSPPSSIDSLPSLPFVRRPRPHITIISDLECEKRSAHPIPPYIAQYRSRVHNAILDNRERKKHEAHPFFLRETKKLFDSWAGLKRVPTISITPIPILKAPTPPPQSPALAPVAVPSPDVVKKNGNVMSVVFEILAEETGQDVCDPETVTVPDATMTSGTGMLRAPFKDVRSRLYEDDLSRYYPEEYAEVQLARELRLIARSKHREAFARRRELNRRNWEATLTDLIPPSLQPPLNFTPP